MKRFCDMMPSDEIEMSKTFTDGSGLQIDIDAGPHGWTVLMADGSSMYSDVDRSTEENMEKAISAMKEYFPNATEVKLPNPKIELETTADAQ